MHMAYRPRKEKYTTGFFSHKYPVCIRYFPSYNRKIHNDYPILCYISETLVARSLPDRAMRPSVVRARFLLERLWQKAANNDAIDLDDGGRNPAVAVLCKSVRRAEG